MTRDWDRAVTFHENMLPGIQSVAFKRAVSKQIDRLCKCYVNCWGQVQGESFFVGFYHFYSIQLVHVTILTAVSVNYLFLHISPIEIMYENSTQF